MSDAMDALTLARAQLIRDLAALRLVREVKITAPSVGAEWSSPVPGGAVWELLAVSYTYVTSAVVATRTSRIDILDGDAISTQRFATTFSQTASDTQRYVYSAGFGQAFNNNVLLGLLPTPPVVLFSGWQVKTSTLNVDAGDQYSAVILSVREWSEVRIVNASRYAAQTVAEQAAQGVDVALGT